MFREQSMHAISELPGGWPLFGEELRIPILLFSYRLAEIGRIFSPEVELFRGGLVRLGRILSSGSGIEVLYKGVVFYHPIVQGTPRIYPLKGEMRESFDAPRGGLVLFDCDSNRFSEEHPFGYPIIYIGGIRFTKGDFWMKHGVFVLYDSNDEYKCVVKVRLASIAHGEMSWDDICEHEKPAHLREPEDSREKPLSGPGRPGDPSKKRRLVGSTSKTTKARK